MTRWTTTFLDFHQSKWDKSYSQSKDDEIDVSPVYVLYSSNIVISCSFCTYTNLLHFERRHNYSNVFIIHPPHSKYFFVGLLKSTLFPMFHTLVLSGLLLQTNQQIRRDLSIPPYKQVERQRLFIVRKYTVYRYRLWLFCVWLSSVKSKKLFCHSWNKVLFLFVRKSFSYLIFNTTMKLCRHDKMYPHLFSTVNCSD